MATHAAEPAIAAPRALPSAEPPEVPLPKPVQTARFIVRPIPFFEHWRRELGETFRARLFGPGEVVFLSDPESIKRLFTADRVNTIAPGAQHHPASRCSAAVAAAAGGRASTCAGAS